ncbi:hypothetical protein EROM_110020 [Encephalitozoon romaleae SJ-2008]|uniref:Uncharacterized protein n=1 Tax=Encephalitozoon romaleae (strain SJ-2008) TaxID=1178016 RepID=I7AMW9_ENCRO|nr:hypothetical protein EROM_051640 [Encephalitozoon romaleae SJ-2008]XP_009265484.1 hypothetical protein EROM_110020 [Encephalitozoon romaleae SJ-2008]AFN83094.1 hypothetical protein EROM_051640 [Encephalitozoon romaleae SJ-2008]AFN83987.1 hypothetical protein EROM_110020 [Encephalitozoon romaleae SJ-2008]
MLAISVIGIIGLLGGLRGAIPLKVSNVSGKVYKNIRVNAQRICRIMEYVEKPEIAEFMKECLEKQVSERAQELCRELIFEHESLKEKVARLGEAAGNSESSFEELKSLIIEVFDGCFKVVRSGMILDIELGFNEENLDEVEEACSKVYRRLLNEIAQWRNSNGAFRLATTYY